MHRIFLSNKHPLPFSLIKVDVAVLCDSRDCFSSSIETLLFTQMFTFRLYVSVSPKVRSLSGTCCVCLRQLISCQLIFAGKA